MNEQEIAKDLADSQKSIHFIVFETKEYKPWMSFVGQYRKPIRIDGDDRLYKLQECTLLGESQVYRVKLREAGPEEFLPKQTMHLAKPEALAVFSKSGPQPIASFSIDEVCWGHAGTIYYVVLEDGTAFINDLSKDLNDRPRRADWSSEIHAGDWAKIAEKLAQMLAASLQTRQ